MPVVIGKVVSVRSDLGFAVLIFPIGTFPAIDSEFQVYRKGVKVGEVKISGPQQNDNVVGNILNGSIQPGDEVREE